MSYDDWCKAVNTCLRSQGKPFTTQSIDPTILLSGFNAGQSPAVFAQTQTSPSRVYSPSPAPRALSRSDFIPNYRFIRLIREVFTWTAFINWGLGALWLVWVFISSISGAYSVKNQPGIAAWFLAFGFMGALVTAIVVFLSGAVFLFIAQMINLWVRQQMDIEQIAHNSGSVPKSVS